MLTLTRDSRWKLETSSLAAEDFPAKRKLACLHSFAGQVRYRHLLLEREMQLGNRDQLRGRGRMWASISFALPIPEDDRPLRTCTCTCTTVN